MSSTDFDWVLGVDPGGTTGWSLITDPHGDPLGTCTADQAPPEVFLDKLTYHLQASPNGLVAIERFVVTAATARMSPQYDALETIGVVKYLTRRHGTQMVMQTPAQAKKFATDKHLKLWGVYDPKVPHGMDGVRHTLFALMNAGVREWYRPLGMT